ncbi:unnamed protein product [Dovyalis caffra]|uniref:Uncharacterized protein n=1 Tax=Dovyalis caffra TaxID=77055 RepID=A0AAV1RSP4_9ROSI|nr:unnamed protein product [Dovyalis caffra]
MKMNEAKLVAHFFKDRFQTWLRDYDSLQYLALILIYIQIGCSLIGSLGALYNGVLLIDLAISLFALVAIESSSQRLGRTYAVLLFSSILLDIEHFLRGPWNVLHLFSETHFGNANHWFYSEIYRLGVPYIDSTAPREADFDLRSSFLSPSAPAAVARQCSDSDVVLGGSIYDPAYYSSLFEDGQDSKCLHRDRNSGICDNGSTSSAEASQVKVTIRRAFQAVDSFIPALPSREDSCQSQSPKDHNLSFFCGWRNVKILLPEKQFPGYI